MQPTVPPPPASPGGPILRAAGLTMTYPDGTTALEGFTVDVPPGSVGLAGAAVRAGARGYLLKDADEDEIATVLRGIARGEAIFGPGTAGVMLDHLARVVTPLAQPSDYPFPQLTTREREVLELLAHGQNNTAIAGALFLSERTVRNYVSLIFTKLQVDDRAHAIATARDAGIAAIRQG